MSSTQPSIRSPLSSSFPRSGLRSFLLLGRRWAYNLRGVLARMAVDLVMANLGFFLGYLVTIFYSAFIRSEVVTSAWICDVLLPGWMSAFPLFTIICLAAFTATGLYSIKRGCNSELRPKILLPLAALGIAYSLCFLGLHAFRADGGLLWPYSAACSGIVLSYVLVAGLRTGKQLFSNRYVVEPRYGQKHAEVKYVLVVGGAGYIGSTLVRRLLHEQYHVRVLDSLMFGDQAIRDLYGNSRFELMVGDFRTIETIVRSIRGMDAVIHLGAIVGDPACALDADYTLSVNTEAVRALREICRGYGVRRFLFASTCSVYGAQDQLINEHSPLAPVSLYARSKIDAEQAILAMQNEEFRPTILRLATAFGLSYRMRYDLVVNLLTAQAINKSKITIFNGNQWRPFIHVNDIARAFVTCLQAPLELVAGQVFNAGDDESNLTLTDLGELVGRLVPGTEVCHQENSADKRSYRVDFSKIRQQLGFRCLTTVEDGIEELVQAVRTGKHVEYEDMKYNNAAYLQSNRKQFLTNGSPPNGNGSAHHNSSNGSVNGNGKPARALNPELVNKGTP
jgi:nucleoside-diphosphate-sugar epimerase